MLKKLRKVLLALHKDEGGADMVEYILLVALVGLPLLALIWAFRDKITTWIDAVWENLTGQTGFGTSGSGK